MRQARIVGSNITKISAGTYTDRGRLGTATVSGGAVSYKYNGFEQRVLKTGPTTVVPTGARYYTYDEGGHLLGEYDATLLPLYEVVYLGDTPVGAIRYAKTGNKTVTWSNSYSFVYTDHLGTPRLLARNTDHAIQWRWDTAEAFGATAPNENPNSLGVFSFGLRFPGQVYDAETGNFYNWHRDYSPRLGRYVQSDPIGLEGGINTYAYVGGNPVRYSDPSGKVRWDGTMKGATVATIVGGSGYIITLDSECVNGKKARVKIYATGPTIGLDVKGTLPAGATSSSVTVNDRLDTLNPSVLNGWFNYWSIGASLGKGYSCSKLHLGGSGLTLAKPIDSGAESTLSCDWEKGVELGAGTTGGTSTVVESSVQDCDCDKK